MGKVVKDRWKHQKHLSILRKCLKARDREESVKNDLITSMKSEEPYYLVAENLHYTAAWGAARGILATLDGTEVTGNEICSAWRRSALDVACLAERCLPSSPTGVRRTQFSWVDVVRVANMLLFSYSFNITKYINLFGEFLSMLRNGRVLENPKVWIDAPTAHLAYILYLDSCGRLSDFTPTEAEQKTKNLHSAYYVSMMQADNANANRLYEMLLEFRQSATDTYNDPYNDLLFGILPIEFMAAKRYYQSKGVKQGLPSHEMLTTPLLTLKWQSNIEDPLYATVKRYCCSKRPSLTGILI
jgi:hypothetical protein